MINRNIMLFVVLLIALVSSSSADPFSKNEIAKPRADDLNYRLSTDVLPIKYILKLIPDLDNKNFTGSVTISLDVVKETATITLHRRELEIDCKLIEIEGNDPSNPVTIEVKECLQSENAQEYFNITTKTPIPTGEYTLSIPKFSGNLLGYRGFYYAEYVDAGNKIRKLATTHFEPTSARKAFPCFDEPSFKARFEISITRPPSYSCESNMKLKSTDPNTNTDTFEDSIPMSTYLVAFIVSEMKLTDEIPNTIVRTLAPHEDIILGYASYSVDVGNNTLNTIQKIVNVPYSINKLYQAAIPDNYFTPGAMENWGLVTYRKQYLLLTPETSTSMQQQIDTIIAHEFAHQWFGNLATQEWWEYLWLSEGFATYFQYKAVDMIKPDWKLMDQFVIRVTQLAFGPDSLNSTRAMNHDVGSPTEISALFDRIAYEKSGAVIRMLEAILTMDVFKLGLQNYLTKWEFKSATPLDLYEAFDEILLEPLPYGLSVEKMMTTWDSIKGYPLITVTRNYDSNQQLLHLTQDLFFFNEISTESWVVPINYATKSNPNFEDVRATEWLTDKTKTISIVGLKGEDWLLVNKQEAYYYRVNYDEQNWNLLKEALENNHTHISTLNRAQIIDDSFNIAKFEILNYSTPLSIAVYLKNEIEYAPLQSFFNAIAFLNEMISGTSAEKDLQDYVLNALEGSHKHLGFEVKANDSHTDKLNRANVINHLCKFNHPECRSKSLDLFNKWKGGLALPLDLESQLLCGAMREAALEDWNYLYHKYNTSHNARFQSSALSALGCSEKADILVRFLDIALPLSTTDQRFNQAISSITKGSSTGVKTALTYVSEHFKFLSPLLGSARLEAVIKDIGSKITTEELLSTLEALSITDDRYKDVFLDGLNLARANIEWNEKHLEHIKNSLIENNKTGSATHITLSIFVVLIYGVIINLL